MFFMRSRIIILICRIIKRTVFKNRLDFSEAAVLPGKVKWIRFIFCAVSGVGIGIPAPFFAWEEMYAVFKNRLDFSEAAVLPGKVKWIRFIFCAVSGVGIGIPAPFFAWEEMYGTNQCKSFDFLL